MSSLAHNAKKKMAGMLQKLLGKLADAPARTRASRSGETPPPLPRPLPLRCRSRQSAPAPAPRVHSNGKGIELPLQPIIAGLPLELQPRLKHQDAGALTICVPLEKILAQLASGAVKIPFGELRQAAPDLFTEDTDRDQVLVPIPLAEVLARLTPP